MWRLDTDSFLLGEAAADPFAQMAAAGATYGWVHAFQDDPMFVTGLWDTTATYLKARNISQARARVRGRGSVEFHGTLPYMVLEQVGS